MEIGALFDWDGVVIDSRAAHEKSWDILAEIEDLPLFEGHFLMGFGQKNHYIIPHILKWTDDLAEVERLSLKKEELYREILREGGLEALPGVRELLQELKEANIPCAVGSSTTRLNIDTIIEILGLEGYFSEIVSAENVKRGKPEPDVFLKGAELINRDPAKCVVFEDAQVGIDAARAAGCACVGVGTTHPKEELKNASITVHRLNEIRLEDIMELF